MSVIAIDTASRTSAWVLLTEVDGTVIEQRELPARTLDRRLPAAIAQLIGTPPRAVVVLTGPGSYSGVRAGMAAALGLADALHLRLHGLGTLAAVAGAARVVDGSAFSALGDAGRGGLYIASFRNRDGRVEQLSPVRRIEPGGVDRSRRLFATGEIPGLSVEILDPVQVLAAAVPRAMASPPLPSAGLAAVHAAAAAGDLGSESPPLPPATSC